MAEFDHKLQCLSSDLLVVYMTSSFGVDICLRCTRAELTMSCGVSILKRRHLLAVYLSRSCGLWQSCPGALMSIWTFACGAPPAELTRCGGLHGNLARILARQDALAKIIATSPCNACNHIVRDYTHGLCNDSAYYTFVPTDSR